MMKLITTAFFVTLTQLTQAQDNIKIGTNKVEIKGVKINEITLIPGNVEEGNSTKETTYYWDGAEKTFTQITYTTDNTTRANVYVYKKSGQLKPVLSTVKSRIYKGGLAYAVYVNCNKKICATQKNYDTFSDGPTVRDDAAVTIVFATKARARAFMKGIKSPM